MREKEMIGKEGVTGREARFCMCVGMYVCTMKYVCMYDVYLYVTNLLTYFLSTIHYKLITPTNRKPGLVLSDVSRQLSGQTRQTG